MFNLEKARTAHMLRIKEPHLSYTDIGKKLGLTRARAYQLDRLFLEYVNKRIYDRTRPPKGIQPFGLRKKASSTG